MSGLLNTNYVLGTQGNNIAIDDQNGVKIKEEKSNINLQGRVALISCNDHLPPLVRAIKASAERNAAVFHFPGHKRGEAAPSALSEVIGKKPFFHDATELPELDYFSCPKGPLLQAKNLAANLFGAKETWFLVGGTSCGVQAAIMATCSPGEIIIMPRNAHLSATAGVILSGAIPKYLMPQHNSDWDVAAGIMPFQVNKAINESKREGIKVGAVFITSPTYNGICSNLDEISRICRSNGIPLIVDEAHGAHFKFHPEMPKTALEQGADISVQSTHKVLCSFSQSSMLHISGSQIIDRERLHKCLHALQSTSPNWLLLASLDAARHQLSLNPNTIFNNSVKLANKAKNQIIKIPGISILELPIFPDFTEMDPLRLTIGVWEMGISGFQANQILDKDLRIVPELVGTKSVTLAFSNGTTERHIQKLVSGLKNLSTSFSSAKHEKEKVPFSQNASFDINPESRLNPREAFFARKMKLEIKDCIGEICGETICPFPPGIPVLIPGEVITKKAVDYLEEIKNHGGIINGAADPTLSSIIVCTNSNE